MHDNTKPDWESTFALSGELDRIQLSLAVSTTCCIRTLTGLNAPNRINFRQWSERREITAAKPSLTHPNEANKSPSDFPHRLSCDSRSGRCPSTFSTADSLLGMGAAFSDTHVPFEGYAEFRAQDAHTNWWLSKEADDPLDRFFRSQEEELVPRLLRAMHTATKLEHSRAAS